MNRNLRYFSLFQLFFHHLQTLLQLRILLCGDLCQRCAAVCFGQLHLFIRFNANPMDGGSVRRIVFLYRHIQTGSTDDSSRPHSFQQYHQ